MKSLLSRKGFWYLRKHVPEPLRPAFNGQREVWRSLGTTDRREAERRFHPAMTRFNKELEEARHRLQAGAEEAERMASPQADAALRRFSDVARRMHLPSPPFAPPIDSAEAADFVKRALQLGQVQERPQSRAEAVEMVDRALAQLDWERENAVFLSLGTDEDGEPHWVVPVRYLDALEEWVEGQFTATKRTLEAIRAELLALGDAEAAPVSDGQATTAEAAGLKELSAVWEAQRRPAASTRREMRTAVARFSEVNGPLAYRSISVEHVKRFKAALHADEGLRSATKQKRWAMIRTLMSVAREDALIEDAPFEKVRLGKLADDAEAREDLTKTDLKALFARLEGDEWWLVRLGLYTGARLGELCQLTKADVVAEEGVLFLSVSADAEAGRTVKTRNSVRRVPVHKQLLADGFEEWVAERPGDRLFPWESAVASKRLMRRFRDAGLGKGKVFHSLRHTFISAARTVMEEEWREKLTGHRSQRVGRAYGGYADLKAKIDLVSFGLETG